MRCPIASKCCCVEGSISSFGYVIESNAEVDPDGGEGSHFLRMEIIDKL